MPRSTVLFITCLAVIVSACSSPLATVQEWTASRNPAGPGAIPMVPYTQGSTRSVAPSGCSQIVPGVHACERVHHEHELLVLNAQCAPTSHEAMLPELAAALGLEQLPEPVRSYRGRELVWQWYEAESKLENQGLPELPDDARYRIALSLAQPEGGFCLVALITLPGDWEQDSRFYESLFSNAMYNTTALPWPTAPEAEGDPNG